MSRIPDFDIQKEKLEGTILIEASAGTGKTFTLALLVLRLLVEGEKALAIQEIVAVTFTKAATAELKERIAKFLRLSLGYLQGTYSAEEVDTPPLTTYLDAIPEKNIPDARQRIESALLTIDEAAIFTIHGFCQRVLNDFAFESGAEFGREMITDQSDLIHEISTNFWRSQVLTLQPQEYNSIVKTIKTPEELHNRVQSVLTFPQVQIEGKVEEKPDLTSLQRSLITQLQTIEQQWSSAKDEIIELFHEAHAAGTLNGTTYGKGFWADWIESIEAFLRGESSDVKRLQQISYSAIKTKGKAEKPSHQFLHFLDDELPRIEELLDSLKAIEFEMVTWIETSYIQQLTTELARVKEARNQSSFDDIITGVYKAMSDENPRRDLFISLVKNRFKAVLVDEFQDTDQQQFEIFKTLFGQSLFFMIGDPKQAIYRFRGGDVYAYLEAKNQPGLRQFTLRKNFRSEQSVITELNRIFSVPGESPFITKNIEYHSIESGSSRESISLRQKQQSPVVVWKSDTPINPRGIKGTVSKTVAINRINSQMIGEIEKLLTEQWEIGSKDSRKRIKAGNIAILVGSHGEGRTLKELLTTRGIPAVTMRSGNIYTSEEAEQLLNILEAVQTPSKGALIKALLFQKPFEFSYTQIEAEQLNVMKRFMEYHDIWAELGILPMLNSLFKREKLFSKQISSDFEGFRPLTNYRHLFELLHLNECELGNAPLRLIARFRELRNSGSSEELQQRMESDESAVKIVTIHASKGLEYPVVFVPYPWALTTTFTESSTSPRRIIHPLFNRDGQITLNLAHDAEKDSAVIEANEEFQRLFYVALTRASHRLYLSTLPIWPKKEILDETVPTARFIDPLFHAESSIEWRELFSDTQAESAPYSSEKTTLSGVVREFTGTITSGDQTRSYSSVMLHPPHVKHERTEPEKDSIFAFPKGARTGNAWHRIFEIIDYTKPLQEQEEGFKRAMDEFGFVERADSFNCVREMVISTLNAPLNQHYGIPFTLSKITKQQMLTEMSFYLKANEINPLTVAEIIKRHEGFDVSIRPEKFSGYLQGFIDLIFEYQNRYYILDWKSNHLGNGTEHYTQDKLVKAMKENEYRLQYILYTVAVTRFLQETLENFSYDFHMGGAYYVFLRGVNRNGIEGFYYHLPKREMIMELLDHFCSETVEN